MQTFLPYSDFQKSAECLDYKRLGKQRIEAWQIYLALTKKNYGWKNHPAVKMWKGYEFALLEYGKILCERWLELGYKDSMWFRFFKELGETSFKIRYPKWLGNKKFHAAMRSNLLRKNYAYYSKFKWKEKNNLPYYWPVEISKGEK